MDTTEQAVWRDHRKLSSGKRLEKGYQDPGPRPHVGHNLHLSVLLRGSAHFPRSHVYCGRWSHRLPPEASDSDLANIKRECSRLPPLEIRNPKALRIRLN